MLPLVLVAAWREVCNSVANFCNMLTTCVELIKLTHSEQIMSLSLRCAWTIFQLKQGQRACTYLNGCLRQFLYTRATWIVWQAMA